MERIISTILLIGLLSGCDFEVPGADEKFGTQNFVSAVSTIELHKLRNGVYPKSLKDLEFLGDWDGIWLSAVRYQQNGDGYNLYLERGWVGKPSLEFPVKFKQGLDIREINVTWSANKHNHQALTDYQNQVFDDFNKYAALRQSLYASEQRFANSGYWQRRQGFA